MLHGIPRHTPRQACWTEKTFFINPYWNDHQRQKKKVHRIAWSIKDVGLFSVNWKYIVMGQNWFYLEFYFPSVFNVMEKHLFSTACRWQFFYVAIDHYFYKPALLWFICILLFPGLEICWMHLRFWDSCYALHLAKKVVFWYVLLCVGMMLSDSATQH